MILLIDNYDSFVYNLARYFERLGQPTRVVRNDSLTLSQIERMQPSAVVLSPGPCRPQQAGCSLEVASGLPPHVPLLGICLGHQAIAEAFGGVVTRANLPMHGRTSRILHDGQGVFTGLPSPFTACRYHSLIVDESTLPDCLEVSARSEDETIMAIRHRVRPIVGLQFHPESILTEHGYALLAGFLQLARLNFDPGIAQLKQDGFGPKSFTRNGQTEDSETKTDQGPWHAAWNSARPMTF